MDGDVNRFGTVAVYTALGQAFVAMCAVIPVLFVIELIDAATGHWLDQAGGIRPRELTGLDGVVFAPLLHANFAHLYGNSVPLLVTGTFVLATGVRRFLLVTGTVALFSGLGDWFAGPAHLFGLIGGVVAAVVFRRPREVPPGDLLGPIGIGGPAPTLPPE